MALLPNFTSNEDLSNNNLVTFTDTSSGVDSNITNRTIQVQLSDGSYLVPNGASSSIIQWSYSLPSIQVDLLKKSTTANVTVIWYNGSTAVYTKTILMEWDLYDFVFLFGLLSNQTGIPTIISDANYYMNNLKMIVNLWNSENATAPMGDIYSSQSALDKNFYIMKNQSNFF